MEVNWLKDEFSGRTEIQENLKALRERLVLTRKGTAAGRNNSGRPAKRMIKYTTTERRAAAARPGSIT
jgi:hypothetical protein